LKHVYVRLIITNTTHDHSAEEWNTKGKKKERKKKKSDRKGGIQSDTSREKAERRWLKKKTATG